MTTAIIIAALAALAVAALIAEARLTKTRIELAAAKSDINELYVQLDEAGRALLAVKEGRRSGEATLHDQHKRMDALEQHMRTLQAAVNATRATVATIEQRQRTRKAAGAKAKSTKEKETATNL